MTAIRVKPVEIIGHCRAGLTPEDEFQVVGVNVVVAGHSNLCIGALSHLAPVISTLQREGAFFAHVRCQNCTGVGQENRVVFLLGHADKWELCRCLSEYTTLCEACGEPATARRLKAEATEHQSRGEYADAVRKMAAAVDELRRAAVHRETFLYYNRA